MKSGIHPNYVTSTVTCGCGNTFTTISSQAEVRVEICAECHPYYTGKQKFVDTAGRVQKFEKRFQWNAEELAKQKSAAARKAPKEPKKKLPTKTKGKAKKTATAEAATQAAEASKPAPAEAAPEQPQAEAAAAAPEQPQADEQK